LVGFYDVYFATELTENPKQSIYSKMFWVDMECFLWLGMKFFFSEKDVFFYFNRQSLPPNVAFVV